MLNKYRREGLKERVEIPRGQDLLKGLLQRIDLRYKRSLDLRSGFIIKFHQISIRIVMKRLTNLVIKREAVETHHMRSLHVPSAEMVILVNVWL